ncbi:Pycsar system effector family protein [Streptomyces sp. NPDC090021]|uniref:Pycsar system effector family protein n=1 Tax=Streptomyces sp. NPDC090021 TaxID=3365919 RepID=UPI003806975D
MRSADDHLAQAHAEVMTEIARTDSKASALLTALGIPLAVLVAVLPGRGLPVAGTVLAGIAVAGMVAAMLSTLFVLRPHISHATEGSFLRWAECSADEVLADLAVDRRTAQLVVRSQIARRKFAALRTAIHITAASVSVLALALLVGLVA